MKFKDIPVFTKFRLTLDWKAGIDIVYVKMTDAVDSYNAVKVSNPDYPLTIAADFEVTVI